MEQDKTAHGRHKAWKSPSAFSLVGMGLAVVFVAAAFFSGVHVGSDMRLGTSVNSLFAASEAEQTVDLGRFWAVWKILNERFVSASSTDPLSEEDRINGAIQGLVNAYGDPYTVYFLPEDAALFQEDVSGNFQGVGMEVGSRDDVLTVIAPLPNTPAEKAGIRSGDKIIRIDGDSTENMSVDAAVKRIRGEKGTEVTFTILRKGEGELREIAVVRDTINIPTVKTETRGDTFIIRLFNFSAISEAKFGEAIREYVRSDKTKLILDLRGNPGGYLESAVSIASYFLPTGKVIVRESFGEGVDEKVHRSTGRLLGKHAPEQMVVLVDGGSASASEILAGALSEHNVATLIGTDTFGKGSVQELLDLDDGSSLKVTIARWLTPDGNSISAGGLKPDVKVEVTAEQQEKGEDPQLEAAIDYLDK
ncbi:S41 family peptidase [Candidatus Kaiserbacteria bacterium]|nr:S41 family peptidase [Candidatus Kaiserbacteria bacterium]